MLSLLPRVGRLVVSSPRVPLPRRPNDHSLAPVAHKFQAELRWIGKLPGSLHQVKARGKTGHFRRFKVDEEAGYLISTIIEGGLIVVDIHDNRILWSLDEVLWVLDLS